MRAIWKVTIGELLTTQAIEAIEKILRYLSCFST
jgi:hypothetical protein